MALTGDLIHNAAGFPVALALIESLRPRFGAYFCPGNHDYSEYTEWGIFGARADDEDADARGIWSRATEIASTSGASLARCSTTIW